MEDAIRLAKLYKKVQEGEDLVVEDFVNGDFSVKDKKRLLKLAEDDVDRNTLYLIAAPVLKRLSPRDRTETFDFIENTPWADATFEDRGERVRDLHRWASAIIPVPEIIHMSGNAREKYSELADTNRGQSTGDLGGFFRPLAGALRQLKNSKQREIFFERVCRVAKRGMDARNTVIRKLPELMEIYDDIRLEKRYIQPIEEIPKDHPTAVPRNSIWYDVPGALASSLEKLLPQNENQVPLLVRKLETTSHWPEAHDLVPMLASGIPSVLAVAPQHVDTYIEKARITSSDFNHNNWNFYLKKALGVVNKKDVLPLLEFSTEGELYANWFAMSRGSETYVVEGFKAFTRRRDLARIVEQGENDIGYWILDEAEKRMAKGDKAAQDYVKAMNCLSKTHYENAREVFHRCNAMIDEEQLEFPQRVKSMVETNIYISLDKKGRYDAIQLFEELYWADKEDGRNREQLFLDTAEKIREMYGQDTAKKFMSGLKDFSIKGLLEMNNGSVTIYL